MTSQPVDTMVAQPVDTEGDKGAVRFAAGEGAHGKWTNGPHAKGNDVENVRER